MNRAIMGQTVPAAKGSRRKQDQAIANLLAYRTIPEAAAATGVSKRTLNRWLAEAAFSAEYWMARRRIVEGATGLLRAAMARAVTNLDTLANDENTPAAARVTASSRIVELSLRAHELEDLEQRVTMLEQMKGNGNER